MDVMNAIKVLENCNSITSLKLYHCILSTPDISELFKFLMDEEEKEIVIQEDEFDLLKNYEKDEMVTNEKVDIYADLDEIETTHAKRGRTEVVESVSKKRKISNIEVVENSYSSRLIVLGLNAVKLELPSCKLLGELIRRLTSLNTLEMSFNRMDNEMGITVVNGIVNNMGIKNVSITHNFLGDEVAVQLSNGIQIASTAKRSNISYLNLSSNLCGGNGIVKLFKALGHEQCNIAHLDLSSIMLAEQAVKALCKLLEDRYCKLHILNLADCELTVLQMSKQLIDH
jgi:Leucine-rich repeat (LRR) protein